jgi:iron(III) transport system ATP-binding protein
MMTLSRIDKVMSTDVTIQGVAKSFGDKQVLKAIDLTIEKGKFFTIIGPSGCGKTTLLRIISGFQLADRGKVCFNDQEVTSLPPWERNIGYVFQNYALWPHMKIFDNIAYGLKIRKKSMDFIKKKVEWALEIVNLKGVEKQYPSELSGGMQQRVAIARAIVIEPSLLLLDEPLSNLDAKLRVALRKQIKEIQSNLSITAIYVTHDQEEALEISDRLAVLNAGNLQQVGLPSEVYENPQNLFVADFLGEGNFIKGKVSANGEFLANDFPLKFKVGIDEVSKGKDVTLMVRPEKVVPSTSENDWQVEGRIVQCYYLGSRRKYILETTGGLKILLVTFKDLGSEGSLIRLKFENYQLLTR